MALSTLHVVTLASRGQGGNGATTNSGAMDAHNESYLLSIRRTRTYVDFILTYWTWNATKGDFVSDFRLFVVFCVCVVGGGGG